MHLEPVYRIQVINRKQIRLQYRDDIQMKMRNTSGSLVVSLLLLLVNPLHTYVFAFN